MGAWGLKTFECDGALDWYNDFCSSDQSIKELKHTFNVILLNTDYLDCNECMAALAAGEIIAAAIGFPPDDFPNGAYHDDENDDNRFIPRIQLHQIGEKIERGLIKKAMRAIQKVKQDDDSELREFFEESNHYEDWLKEVDDLLQRIDKI